MAHCAVIFAIAQLSCYETRLLRDALQQVNKGLPRLPSLKQDVTLPPKGANVVCRASAPSAVRNCHLCFVQVTFLPERYAETMSTRKLCYRKDDRAMRPRSIYGCPENFLDSLTIVTTPTATFPKNLYAFVPMVPSKGALLSMPSIHTIPLALVCPKF